MTLTDISRLLKLAHVPRSKVIQWGYPNPQIIVHVDASHVSIVSEVVGRMKLPHEDIAVTLLTTRDVRPNEHVYINAKGEVVPPGRPYNDAGMPEAFYRRYRARTARARNSAIVLECRSVVAL